MSELTKTEQEILQLYKIKNASVISAMELVRAIGSDASHVTGLMQKEYVQRQTVKFRTFYVLLKDLADIKIDESRFLDELDKLDEPDELDEPVIAKKQSTPRTWKPAQSAPVPVEGAIDRHLRQWGSCTIQEASFIPWEPDAKPIYQMLEGKNRW